MVIFFGGWCHRHDMIQFQVSTLKAPSCKAAKSGACDRTSFRSALEEEPQVKVQEAKNPGMVFSFHPLFLL